MIRSFKTEGIIIKRRNFGELDRILTVLTKTNGKIQVRAPGVRKITSRRSSHIELLNLCILTLYKSSRSLFAIVTEAQTLENFLPIKNNLPKVGFAYYVCELVDSLCAENQENRRVFFLVRDVLSRLENDYSRYLQELRNRHSGDPSDDGDSRIPNGNERFWTSQNDEKSIIPIIEDFENKLLVYLGFLPEFHKLKDKRDFIENILERRLITKRLIPLFLDKGKC